MLDVKLLAAVIASRGAYDRVAPHITEKDLTPPVQFWWGLVKEWYERDRSARFVDVSVIAETGRARIKNAKHTDTLMGLIGNLPDSGSNDNVVSSVVALKRHNAGLELAKAIADHDDDRVKELLPRYQALRESEGLGEAKRVEDARDWGELDEVVGSGNRVFVAPRKLNDKLNGGALPGHHIGVFGRPEIGKSTVVINMAAGFLHYGQRVAYIENEDNINVTKARLRNRITDMTDAEIARDPERANRIAVEKTGDRLLMRHINKSGMDEVERAIDEFQPTVVILNQIRNVGGKGDSLTVRMEQNAIAFRAIIAKARVIGISVAQAHPGEHGRPPKVELGMDDAESSRTGWPAQLDLQVGIGASNEMLQRNQRFLSLPKNKLSSAPDAHEGVVVEIDKSRSKVI